ncbi:hypothetical protein J2796_000450 [Chryseobacterium vietnamense]|uniref:Uncharacterized protein n=1 Tax=Chryseobacterium aquifrigidense TaxID=558021 RepID=A0A543EMH8_9FLAO|nr:hypothetical protein [Chryseobacterium vietnamense]TQM22780.1 hypothetical protein FB551_2500 [Chryseobacterium aquifrigidense]
MWFNIFVFFIKIMHFTNKKCMHYTAMYTNDVFMLHMQLYYTTPIYITFTHVVRFY